MNRRGASDDAVTPNAGTPGQTSVPLPNETDQAWQDAMAREKFRFRFSLRELLTAMTAAAVIFGLVRLLGGMDNTAILLGFVALGGLVISALGFDPPELWSSAGG